MLEIAAIVAALESRLEDGRHRHVPVTTQVPIEMVREIGAAVGAFLSVLRADEKTTAQTNSPVSATTEEFVSTEA